MRHQEEGELSDMAARPGVHACARAVSSGARICAPLRPRVGYVTPTLLASDPGLQPPVRYVCVRAACAWVRVLCAVCRSQTISEPISETKRKSAAFSSRSMACEPRVCGKWSQASVVCGESCGERNALLSVSLLRVRRLQSVARSDEAEHGVDVRSHVPLL